MQPLVSIAMPVRNSSSTLELTLRSIVNQTYANWELIVIDDGSVDATLDIIRSFDDPRIRLIRREHSLGLAQRLNECVSLARGEFLARMDGDDLCFPDRIQKQSEFLQSNREVDLLGTRVVVFNQLGMAIGTIPFAADHQAICEHPSRVFTTLAHPTWMGRTEWFRRFPYNPRYQKSQDREILLRAFRSSHFACLPDFLLGYRQDNLTMKKIIQTRWFVGRALLAQAVQHREPPLAFGAFMQFIKTGWDAVAIGSGLRYRLWKHRALPLPSDVENGWRLLWASLTNHHVSEAA